MVTFLAAPGLLVTLPMDELMAVRHLAQVTDSIVFWQRGHHRDGTPGAWLPLLLPRALYQSGGES